MCSFEFLSKLIPRIHRIPTMISIISTPISRIPTLIPRIPTLVFIIPTLIPHIPIFPTLIPRVPHIPTLIPRIPCIPTLIPCIPIIPLKSFPDSPFQLLQIAKIKCTISISRQNSKSYGTTKKVKSSEMDTTTEFAMLRNPNLQAFTYFGFYLLLFTFSQVILKHHH